MRLIDADELKRRILHERDKIPFYLPGATYEFGIRKPNHHGNSMRGGIRKALRCMEQCPTIKAKLGQWEDFCRGKMCCCSVCKAEFDNTCNAIHEEWKFCPNCGNPMTVEVQNEID